MKASFLFGTVESDDYGFGEVDPSIIDSVVWDVIAESLRDYEGVHLFAGPPSAYEAVRVMVARASAQAGWPELPEWAIEHDDPVLQIRVCLPFGPDGDSPQYSAPLAAILAEAVDDEIVTRTEVAMALRALADRFEDGGW